MSYNRSRPGELLMIESLPVLAVVLTVGFLGIAASILTPPMITEMGLWLLIVGLLTGLPTGLWCHVLLYRALAPRQPLPPSWWRSPVQYHALLAPDQAARIKPWFPFGGIGYVLSLAGGLAAMAGLLLDR
jgi:hypothetical protein